MNKIQKGFTLIELMIVVAIIAILAAIALPAYQDYMVRAKLSEVFVAGDACKNSVVEFYEGQGHLPPNLSSAGCNNNTTKYIASTTMPAAGQIIVTTTAATDLYGAASLAYGLLPTPVPANPDVLQWTCNTAAGTTFPAKYVPSLCR
ncbi:pilin [Dokdonella soli]|uniref:Pilin n=1 Tax=Dokdonella soli TaxID=529810 RepID=A0ABP3TSH1_9GAMM